jgi:YD repeat-containing protein
MTPAVRQASLRSFEYYPGGQPKYERVGTRSAPVLERSFEINGLNQPWRTLETAAGIAGTLETTTSYDEAGNVVSIVDRRGVRRTTAFDYGDRPESVTLEVVDGARFSAQGGDPAGLPAGGRTVATFEYDGADGGRARERHDERVRRAGEQGLREEAAGR